MLTGRYLVSVGKDRNVCLSRNCGVFATSTTTSNDNSGSASGLSMSCDYEAVCLHRNAHKRIIWDCW
jgi:hypothetical protein